MIRKLLILSCTLLLLSHESSALIQSNYLGGITVNVDGNNRTQRQYIESLVKKCLEKGDYKTWETVDAGALGQCISNTRLFSKVDVQIKKPEISVRISERWTLIPMPNVYSSNGKRSAGVFLYESNFLGYGKTVGAGGAVSTEGNTFSLMYRDPSVNFSDFTFLAMAFRSNREVRAYDRTTTLYGYNAINESFILSPGYKITPFISLSASVNYADKRYSQLESFDFPEDYASWSVGARASYTNSDYKLFYNDGFSAHLGWNKQVRRSDHAELITGETAGLEWNKLILEKHVLQLALHGATQLDAHAGDVSMYGMGKGYRGIQPGGLWTRRIAAASVDYQIPVARWGHGTVTVAPFVDYGTYKPFFEGTGNNYTAYGIGAYYFINLINLSGVGLTAGMNESFMGAFVAFQIGMGFGER